MGRKKRDRGKKRQSRKTGAFDSASMAAGEELFSELMMPEAQGCEDPESLAAQQKLILAMRNNSMDELLSLAAEFHFEEMSVRDIGDEVEPASSVALPRTRKLIYDDLDPELARDLVADVMRAMHQWQTRKALEDKQDSEEDVEDFNRLKTGFHRLSLLLLAKTPKDGVDMKDYLGWSLLMQAVNCDLLDMVRDLLQLGANPNIVDQSGRTALTMAVELCRPNIVQTLLTSSPQKLTTIETRIKSRASATTLQNEQNSEDGEGCTPLMIACLQGYVDIARMLIEVGQADIGSHQDGTGDSCLHLAAMHGHLEVVKLLVNAGLDVNVKNDCEQTAIFGCSSLAIVQYLVQAGLDVAATDVDGETALSIALALGDSDVACYLQSC